jgi:hypothetical protein
MTNTQYLYDSIIHNFPNCKVKAKSFICYSKSKNIFVDIHLALILNGKIIDPSYEINIVGDMQYFDTISKLNNAKIIKPTRKLIEKFINFIEISNQINNGKILITDKKYYNDQADYVESRINLNHK